MVCCLPGSSTTAATGTVPAATPAGAVAQSKVAAKEQTAAGLSGSGGAVRVPAPKQTGEHALQEKLLACLI